MDVLDIFYFFLLGEGKGESEALGGGERWGGIGFFIESPRGGGGGYMREMGAICQIGVFTWKPCTFWAQNGFIFGLFALRFQ